MGLLDKAGDAKDDMQKKLDDTDMDDKAKEKMQEMRDHRDGSTSQTTDTDQKI
jgi:hypothetical protein